MLTETEIQTIKSRLQVVQAHKEAMEREIEGIMKILAKNQAPLKTGIGERAIAEREARISKKTA
jgi:hypothetical protein